MAVMAVFAIVVKFHRTTKDAPVDSCIPSSIMNGKVRVVTQVNGFCRVVGLLQRREGAVQIVIGF